MPRLHLQTLKLLCQNDGDGLDSEVAIELIKQCQEDISALLAVARAAHSVDMQTLVLCGGQVPEWYSRQSIELHKALEVAKQNPHLKAEIEK